MPKTTKNEVSLTSVVAQLKILTAQVGQLSMEYVDMKTDLALVKSAIESGTETTSEKIDMTSRKLDMLNRLHACAGDIKEGKVVKNGQKPRGKSENISTNFKRMVVDHLDELIEHKFVTDEEYKAVETKHAASLAKKKTKADKLKSIGHNLWKSFSKDKKESYRAFAARRSNETRHPNDATLEEE